MQEVLAKIREKFDNSSQDRARTKSLFIEDAKQNQHNSVKFEPLFTIKRDDFVKDGKTYYSLKKIYFSYEHIPGHEYDFAMDVFGSWRYWEALCKSVYYRDMITDWRDEMEIRIRCKSMKSLMDTAYNEGSKGAAYAKYLSEGGWKGNSRGRPSKEEIQRELKVATGIAKEFDGDLERIGLKVVNGGKQ